MAKFVGLTVLLLSAALAVHAAPTPDTAQQAQKAIQSSYNAGVGEVGILSYPTVWMPDKRTVRYTKTVQSVTLHGNIVQVIAFQDDNMTATNPKDSKRHFIHATETYSDTWKYARGHWFLKKSRSQQGMYTIDGAMPISQD